jgi:S-adenosylmethionine hydrolase
VVAGAFAIAQAAPWYPPGTVHVGVVDPGVGSGRRAIVVERGGALFVGPDNGLFSLVTAEAGDEPSTAWVIDRLPESWSVHPTFHGRDLFARVAARLAAGAEVAGFSSGTVEPLRLDLPQAEQANGDLFGVVIHVDRFGNLITNLPGERLVAGQSVDIAGTHAVASTTYADVERGRLLAYVGSAGYVEVAVRDGSAAQLLAAGRGTRLRLRRA